MEAEDVIIVGAGPAGLAAAIQLKRYGLKPLIFECSQAGGLLRNANLVENYPGFPQGISGVELVDLFVRQAQNLSIDVIHEEAINVFYRQGVFHTETRNGSYFSKVMVIATGTKPIRFKNLVIPAELSGRVFYEVFDLYGIEGKCVAIVGSGDAAFDYALNLGKKNQVLLLNRGEHPKCLPLLWERCAQTPSIAYHPDITVCAVKSDGQSGIWLDCQSEAGEIQFHADYLLGAIGREARLDCLAESLRRQEKKLTKQGVFYMIGDVKNGLYRQTSIAVGDGVMAAMKIYHQLKEALS